MTEKCEKWFKMHYIKLMSQLIFDSINKKEIPEDNNCSKGTYMHNCDHYESYEIFFNFGVYCETTNCTINSISYGIDATDEDVESGKAFKINSCGEEFILYPPVLSDFDGYSTGVCIDDCSLYEITEIFSEIVRCCGKKKYITDIVYSNNEIKTIK